jgi:hypothetical protein
MCLCDFESKFLNQSTLTLQSCRTSLASEAFMLRTSSFATIPFLFNERSGDIAVSHDRFQFLELPTSIERILLEVRRKWAKLDLSESVLGMVDRNLPSI